MKSISILISIFCFATNLFGSELPKLRFTNSQDASVYLEALPERITNQTKEDIHFSTLSMHSTIEELIIDGTLNETNAAIVTYLLAKKINPMVGMFGIEGLKSISGLAESWLSMSQGNEGSERKFRVRFIQTNLGFVPSTVIEVDPQLECICYGCQKMKNI